jgi:hypothetical protein
MPGRFPFSPCSLYTRTVRRPSMASPPAAPSPSASPSSLWPYLSTHSSSCVSLCTRSTPTHAIEPHSTGAAVSASSRRRTPTVECIAALFLSFPDAIVCLTWRLLSRESHHQDRATLGAWVPACRSSARAAVTVELHHCCLPFAHELAQRLLEW